MDHTSLGELWMYDTERDNDSDYMRTQINQLLHKALP